jgi:hypothetical protein
MQKQFMTVNELNDTLNMNTLDVFVFSKINVSRTEETLHLSVLISIYRCNRRDACLLLSFLLFHSSSSGIKY